MQDSEWLTFSAFLDGEFQTQEGLFLLGSHKELQIFLQKVFPTNHYLTKITLSYIVLSLKMINSTLLFINTCLFKILNIHSNHLCLHKVQYSYDLSLNETETKFHFS